MCIGTCAWMESEWLAGLAPIDKCCFRGARFMDDILLLTSRARWWDHNAFVRDFARSDCYWQPLKLESGSKEIFLETRFQKGEDGHMQYRLKNANESGRHVWRYHHYLSALDYTTKRATLLSTLQKVDKMASDEDQLVISGHAKCAEFVTLGYPRGIIRYMCATIARDSGNAGWLRVRSRL